ncbi:MAG TPA: hypothetical protein DCM28_17700 [Phycisphaerales bacterium]|nr:hypothetical protein [Phycisphaerales bacterium]HCD32751.1 hypothetical protein [Phycisphaerales bacterium]|tara:strand:- start:104 stop:1189 length:1086 start_codon:yes stop_codon:yes gene_type:complete
MSQADTRNQATMSAIADAAKVSISTVSRVLAGGQGISKQTIEKVRNTANELGYRPKPSAMMRSGAKPRQKSLKIGLLHTFLGDYTPHHSIKVYLHQQFMIEAWEATHQAGHQLCIDYLDLDRTTDRSPLLGPQSDIDGLILKGAIEPRVMQMLPKSLPTVVLRLPMGMPCQYSSVNCNYHMGIARCVQYLHELGHRQIGFFCLANQRFDNMDKITSYQQTLISLGLNESDHMLIPDIKDYADATETCRWAVDQWLNSPNRPTAIISSEGFCHDIAQVLEERGLKVPEDMSLLNAVTGASSYDSMRQHYTRLQMPAMEMSHAAVEHLVRHIRNPQAPPQTVLMEMDFIVGDTTSAPPASADR